LRKVDRDAREVCVGEFPTLDDDFAREFQGWHRSSRRPRSHESRSSISSLIQPNLGSHSRVRAQAVSTQALGDRQRESLASFFVEGSAGERRTQIHESFKRHRRIHKSAKEIRHQREFRSYL
jgi:hypothetical protein